MARADTSMAEMEAAFVKAANGERVVLRHRGQRFVLVTGADLDQLEALEDAADVMAADAALAEGPARPYDELRRKHGLA